MEKETPNQMPEEATTVGMFLKYTRLSQKKSVETVSKDLCIRKIYIKAIEESDITELPPVPYGIGFVRSYAEYLGLNADRVVQCYKEEHLPKKKDENGKKIVTKHTALTIPNRRQILIGLLGLALLYVIWLIASCKPEAETMPPVLPEESLIPETRVQETAESSQDEINEQSVSETDSNPKPETDDQSLSKANLQSVRADKKDMPVLEQNLKEIDQVKIVESSYPGDENSGQDVALSETRVVVKFKGTSWFEIKDAQKVYISGIFKKGFVYNVPDVPGIIFSVGRYYNVDVYIDGRLTQVARPQKQTNIQLDKFLNH